MKALSTTRRTFVGGSALVAGAMLAACGASDDSADTTDAAATDATEEAVPADAITGTYDMHIQGYDWGAGVDTITLTLASPLDAVDPEAFTVVEHKQVTDWTDETFPVVEADVPRQVTNATLNDDGTVTLDLYVSPNDGSPFLYTMATGFNTWCDPYELNIGLAEGAALTSDGADVSGFAIEPVATNVTTSADAWTLDSFTASDGTVFPYAAFDPEEETDTLVIWLHGAGEGGTENTDPRVTILANKVVALSEDPFQETVGGAHVVAPQSPTMWMDIDGNQTYIDTENSTEVRSLYTEALEEFIDAYTEQVGASKVVLAGCSNGGFMTLWMALDRPDKYTAIVPICEAIPDALISDEQIAGLVDLPAFFIYCKNDGTVDPTQCEEPTIARLQEAGKTAETLHVATCDEVVDLSGEYTDEEGNPYAYNTHWSWIYFDNNEIVCDEDGLAPFDFIAEAVK